MTTIETLKVIKSPVSSIRGEQYTANSYGTISLAFDQENSTWVPETGTLWYSDDPLMFCDNSWCSYIFHEANPESLRSPDAIPVVATTDRVINATSQCTSFPVIRGGNGTDSTIAISSREGNTIEIPLPVRGGLDQSTFITDPSDSCGANCSFVSIFEASSISPWYYNCTTTLSQVSNTHLPEHSPGINLTRMATAAIALQGYSTLPTNDDDTSSRAQAVIYPAASVYGTPLNGTTEDMELVLSRFTIGVVAVTALANSQIVVSGHTPHIGQKLNMEHWGMVHLIFGLTAGLQLLFAVVATWIARKVVIPSGGAVAEAQVLRSMTRNELRHEMAEEVNEKGLACQSPGDSGCWIYRDRYVGDGWYDLFVERMPRSKTALDEIETLQQSAQSQAQEGPTATDTQHAEQAMDDNNISAELSQDHQLNG